MTDSECGLGVGVSTTKVKICGLTRRRDALEAAGAGADYLGVVLVPDTPRCRSPQEARAIFDGIRVPSVVVVSNQAMSDVVYAARTSGADVIQLHGDESPHLVEALRQEGPWEVWKALRVRNASGVHEGFARFGQVADGVLLDGWHPERAGGTGIKFSWEAVAGVRDEVPEGLLLAVAGGLTPENVSDAVACLRPHLVDVSSGVEKEPGIKSPSKIESFINNVRAVGQGGGL
jgi:phosphoribosylanthranilate isomerase